MEDLIAIKFNENSDTKWIKRQDAVKIITEQFIDNREKFDMLSDDEKETFIADLIKNTATPDEPIICMSTEWIYKTLIYLRIPENISRTIASWLSWFFVSAKNIAFSFIKTTVLYFFSHQQIVYLLGGLLLFRFVPYKIYKNDVFEAALLFEKGKTTTITHLANIMLSWKTQEAMEATILLVHRIDFLLIIGILGVAGIAIFEFMRDFSTIYSSMKLSCSTQKSSQRHVLSKKEFEKQLDKKIEALIKKSNLSPISEFIQNNETQNNEKSTHFVEHIHKSVQFTPIKDIIIENQIENDYQVPYMSPKEYYNSLYEASIVLDEHSRHPTSRTSRKIQRKLNKYFDESLYKASIRVD